MMMIKYSPLRNLSQVATILVLVVAALPVLGADSERLSEILQYDKFLKEHNNDNRFSGAEWQIRFDQFIKGTVRIFQHNILFLKKEISYHLERNQFSDWSRNDLLALSLEAEDLGAEQENRIQKLQRPKSLFDFNENPQSGVESKKELSKFLELLDRKFGKPLVDQVVQLKEALESEINQDQVRADGDNGTERPTSNPLETIKAGLKKIGAPIKSMLETAKSDFWEYLKDEGIVDVKRQVKERAAETKRVWMRIDWRITKCIGEPRQQGTCNSCYAISIVSLIEYYHCRQFGKLVPFSPQYIVDCGQQAGMRGCRGGKLTKVGQFIQKNGLQLESDFPYTGQEGQCEASSSSITSSRVFPRFKNWQYLNEAGTSDEWLTHLKRGPLLVGIGMPLDFFVYGGGIHDGHNCDPKMVHAMLLIGYGLQDGKEFWLLQNSFSKDWGEKGYFRLAKDAPEHCFNAVIVARPNFPQ